MTLHGLLLAAGAGSRMGLPKALLRHGGTPGTALAVADLLAGGCRGVTVVLGARAEEARAVLEDGVRQLGVSAARLQVVVADGWAEGMGASLRTGLAAIARTDSRGGRLDGVLVTLVDLPDVDARVMRRVTAAWRDGGAGPDALLRATYGGRPGHPVLLGRDHWPPLEATLAGDVGAQPYLERHKVRGVSCDDLATGRDLDRPEDLLEPPAGR